MISLRIMTYNVHHCRGRDGVVSPWRIAELIAWCNPDVVALQEVDIGRARSGHQDQVDIIAGRLKMDKFFHPVMQMGGEQYGQAVLSRLPMTLNRAELLPAFPSPIPLERRAAIWVELGKSNSMVQLLCTHLSLVQAERRLQAASLLGPRWLSDPRCAGHRVLCGDFNAWPLSATYRLIRRVLRDAQGSGRPFWPRNTFPAWFPMVRIDHVFHSRRLVVCSVRVPRTRLTRVASDHLPVVVEVLVDE